MDECGCWTCVDAQISKQAFPHNLMYPFVVCGSCGNKRCPRAERHSNLCTNSNEPGQVGSPRFPAHNPVDDAAGAFERWVNHG